MMDKLPLQSYRCVTLPPANLISLSLDFFLFVKYQNFPFVSFFTLRLFKKYLANLRSIDNRLN